MVETAAQPGIEANRSETGIDPRVPLEMSMKHRLKNIGPPYPALPNHREHVLTR